MRNSFKERCGAQAGERTSKCNSCVCQLLRELAAQGAKSLCMMGGKEKFNLILKGSSEPLSVNGSMATEFTLVRFDEDTCCAVFSFQEGMGAMARTRTIVLDCLCICSVICLGTGNIPPY